MEKKRRIIIAVLLLLSIGNYSTLTGNDNIRFIQFISIFIIGALTGLLINEFVTLFKAKRQQRLLADRKLPLTRGLVLLGLDGIIINFLFVIVLQFSLDVFQFSFLLLSSTLVFQWSYSSARIIFNPPTAPSSFCCVQV